jgi:hypothetical protein
MESNLMEHQDYESIKEVRTYIPGRRDGAPAGRTLTAG